MMPLTRARTDPIAKFIQLEKLQEETKNEKCQRAKAALHSQEAEMAKLQCQLSKQADDYKAQIKELCQQLEMNKKDTGSSTAGYPMSKKANKTNEQTEMEKECDEKVVSCIRCLAMDAVQQANSGHAGTPMAMAPVAYALWSKFLKYDPLNPSWPNRDRFVL
jgi:hypothetical protein